MNSKERLKHFLKHAEPNKEYKFEIVGDVDDAEAFVQRMRVHLTRLKNLARMNGLVLKKFKMVQINIARITHKESAPASEIILMKKTACFQHTPEDVKEILEMLGERI